MVFLRNVIANSRFNERRLNEDFLFLSSLLIDKANSVFIINDIGYNYFSRVNSISKSGYGKSLKDAVYNIRDLAERYKEDKELFACLGAFAVYQARTCIVTMTKVQFREEKEFVALCRKTMKEYRKLLKGSFLAPKDKMFCKLFILCPKTAKILIDAIRKGE